MPPEAQVALTLRHVVGLTDRQISARFLVPEETMTKRLVRARAKIRDARISFELPDRTRLQARLDEVRTVVYLIFTEGYLTSGDGPSLRADLCDEAVWLARHLHRSSPDDESIGLLALLLLQNARIAARRSPGGELVPYDEQDRSLWHQPSIEEAKHLLAGTGTTPPGPYQLQAAIALQHASAPTPDGRRTLAHRGGTRRPASRPRAPHLPTTAAAGRRPRAMTAGPAPATACRTATVPVRRRR